MREDGIDFLVADLRQRFIFHFVRILEIIHDVLEFIFTAPNFAAALAYATLLMDEQKFLGISVPMTGEAGLIL